MAEGLAVVEGHTDIIGISFVSTSCRVLQNPIIADVLSPFEFILGERMNA